MRIFAEMSVCRAAFLSFLFFCGSSAFAQQEPDTARLPEIPVRAYLSSKPRLVLPTSVGLLGQQDLQKQQQTSLVNSVNTIPGVRMEERSPGSYRFSIRGSLLRSPFGIRNIKMYLGDFPLTDAGGNTYLNLIDPESVRSAEILKGPDGSLFGANSGGVVILQPDTGTAAQTVSLQAGSYGLFKESTTLHLRKGSFYLPFFQGYQASAGYRQHSKFSRLFLQTAPRWKYNDKNTLSSFLFYSDLNYQTPGGLTQTQFNAAARQARPRAGPVPGPVIQQAGIRNKTFFGGISHDARFGPVHHVISLFGSGTDFANPFLTNYEVHREENFGLRTYGGIRGKTGAGLNWELNTGLEYQQNASDIANYGNRAGRRDTLQAADHIRTQQHFYFTQLSLSYNRLIFESAVSLNFYRYNFSRPDIEEVITYQPGSVAFSPQLMPRFTLSYKISNAAALRASVSRGYSPPATAEVRASDNRLNTALQPENGWNYEAGIRVYSPRERFTLDASAYYYRLSRAIVRRLNDNGTEYFVNAGGTRQPGIEINATARIIEQRNTGFIRVLQLQHGLSLMMYRFAGYISGTENYSSNKLTGTPATVFVTGLNAGLPKNISLFVQHNYTGSIPLNDANTFYAGAYHYVTGRLSYTRRFNRTEGQVYFGVDNLLDQKFSLGNDLNAFGNRFFNAAPALNWFAGLKFTL